MKKTAIRVFYVVILCLFCIISSSKFSNQNALSIVQPNKTISVRTFTVTIIIIIIYRTKEAAWSNITGKVKDDTNLES